MALLVSWADLLPLAVLAGICGLDVVSFPQAMFSRPIVAATLGGTFVGSPMAGLVCGAALECLALEALPVGASRYPEWGSASVAAGAVAAFGATSATALPPGGSLALALTIGIATAWAGGWTMVKHRRLIAHLAHKRLEQLSAGNRQTVVGLQVIGLSLDLLRGTLVGTLAFVPGRLAASWALNNWQVPENYTRAFVVTCVAAVAAAAVWKDFHAISGTRRLFLASLAVGTIWVVLRA